MTATKPPAPQQVTAQNNMNDVTNLGWSIKPTTQQPGKAITLVGRMRVNNFGPADDIYCAVRHLIYAAKRPCY